MNTRFRLALALLTLAIIPPAQGKVIALLDAELWTAALPGAVIVYSEFDGPRRDFSADSVNALDGLWVALRGGVGDPGPTGPNGDGYLRGELDNSGADALALELRFPATRAVALHGLQNDSLRSPANLDLAEIAFAIGERQWILSELLGAARGAAPFIGFVADAPFSSLALFHAGAISDIGRSSENFYLDRVARAQPVPEPAPLALLLTGLLALRGWRRPRGRRQSTAATASTNAGICASRRPAMLTRLSAVM